MAERKAVVIAVDGLRASALGAYGNTWHETPALDSLAARSVVVDWMYRESPDLAGFFQSAWNEGTLPRLLGDAGVAPSLVTDDAAVAELASAAGIADVCLVDSGAADASAEDVTETALAGLFAVGSERLAPSAADNTASGRLLWIHARGYHGHWDAPIELREDLLEEDDPDAPTFVTPPRFEATDDHDALLAFRAAYAAQTIVLDECVAGLLAALAESGTADDTLVVLVGCRGFALGEHGVVGGDVVALYGETLHVPCLLCAPGLAPAPPRWPHLATVHDLHATLARWFGVAPNDENSGAAGFDLLPDGGLPADDAATRQFVRAAGEHGERSLRTPGWMLRQPPSVPGEAVPAAAELYVKPDDRWEANEIADRCPEIAEQLLASLDGAAPTENAPDTRPLKAELLEPR